LLFAPSFIAAKAVIQRLASNSGIKIKMDPRLRRDDA